jgi:hypothetical protein
MKWEVKGGEEQCTQMKWEVKGGEEQCRTSL